MARAAVCDRLRAAILETTPAAGWQPEDVPIFLDLVQASLGRWVSDIERTLVKADGALGRAATKGATSEGADEIELALMFVVAAREKLVALLAQFLGVRSLQQFKKGIRFFPREKRVRHELQERAKGGSAAASVVLQKLIDFDQLPAIALRNQLAHGVTFLPTVTEICYFKTESLSFFEGSPTGDGPISYLLPEGMLDQGDLREETLFAWASDAAADAVAALDELLIGVVDLVKEVGEIASVTSIYKISGRDEILIEPPAHDYKPKE